MARSTKITSIVSLIIILGILGCGRVVKSNHSPFFPHTDGYRWEYQAITTIGTNEVISAFKRIRYFEGTTTLTNELTVQNFMVSDEAPAQAVWAMGGIRPLGLPYNSPMSYVYVDETGVYDFGTPSNITPEANMLLALPLEVGTQWMRGPTQLITCEAVTEETVMVPAGTFEAIKVNIGEPGWNEWYADGVGMIKLSIDVMVTTFEGGQIIPVEGKYIEELLGTNF